MRHRSAIPVPGVLLCALLCCACLASAALPGGYSDASPVEKDIKSVAKFAVSAQRGAILERIVSAETQVVAGLNYRLKIEVKTPGGLRMAKAVVYRDLKNKMSLTSWEWVAP